MWRTMAVAILLTGCAAQVRPDNTALCLVFDDGSCSGTVIGPHAILSATHCFVGAKRLSIDGQLVTIIDRIDDGHDHTIIFAGARLPHASRIGAAPYTGERVSIYGNPGDLRDMYRTGYIAGTAISAGQRIIVADLHIFYGDSGAGVFNDAGALVAVLSSMYTMNSGSGQSFEMAGMFPLAFTSAQWARARGS